ncbi:MAG: tRNA threonylcarbamoyladenosine dehydratase [Comamonadaceae bacterium]|nr:MAG: tRNA threonylcarbamoyladenosine dehydratase [Comamonadaceae bacterium]
MSSLPEPLSDAPADFDAERRFGALARLYGPHAPHRLAGAHVAVVGLGGVGSWTAEALARCGVGALTLVDLDVVSESNVNRQLHALGATLGQSKIEAMARRIADINPGCKVTLVDDFITPENVAQLLPGPYDALLDCADQASAKIAMILHARQLHVPIVVCGGAGGKTDPLALRGGDLSTALNDALLAKLRNVLRRQHGFARASDQAGKPRKRVPKMNVFALWFDQPALLPAAWTAEGGPQGLSCAGYGSVVTVTAAMGMAAADRAVQWIVTREPA